MKTIIVASLLALFSLLMFAGADSKATEAAGEPVAGDVNCDQTVDARDALGILRTLVGKDQLACGGLADVNCDFQLDSVDALKVLLFAAGRVSTEECAAGKPVVPDLVLSEGELSTEKTGMTSSGKKVKMSLERASVNSDVVNSHAGGYRSTWCRFTVTDSVGGSLWRISLYAAWEYNYHTLRQFGPYPLQTGAMWPYTWSNEASWNSPWSYTVKFADGQARLNQNFPVPGFSSSTKHIYIQEDAWGNCYGRWYQF